MVSRGNKHRSLPAHRSKQLSHASTAPGKFKEVSRDIQEDDEETAVYDETLEGEHQQKGNFTEVGNLEYNLPSDFEDEEIDEDSAFTAEDYKLYGDVGSKRRPSQSRKRDKFLEEIDEEEEAEEDSDLDLNGEISSEEEDDTGSGDDSDEGKRQKLIAIIREMSEKRKSETPSSKKRKFMKERTEIQEESEFSIEGRTSKDKIDLEELLESLQDFRNFGELKKRVASLERAESKNPVAASISEPARERLERDIAFTQLKKKTHHKWATTVELLEKSEKLSFPLIKPPPVEVSNATLSSSFTPSNDFEKSVADLLLKSGVDEKQIMRFEELAANTLSPEEIRERQQLLSKMRSLMFYKEVKAKHQKKIKSKKYHKILKKSKLRHQMSLDEVEAADPEQYEKAVEKREIERIRERMTQKHNSTSKWAKRAKLMKDPGSRKAIQEQLRIHEELKSKINTSGTAAAAGDSDGEDQSENSDAEAQADRQQVQAIDSAMESTKGIFGMKFMQKALESQKKSLMELHSKSESAERAGSLFPGRRSFAPSTTSALSIEQAGTSSAQEAIPISTAGFRSSKTGLTESQASEYDSSGQQPKKHDQVESRSVASSSNPWLTLETEAPTAVTASAVSTPKRKKPATAANKKGASSISIDSSDLLTIKSDEENEDGEHFSNLLSSQKSIVEQAFGTIDYEDEFDLEKQQEIDGQVEEVESKKEKLVNELPGWGSWTGFGIRKKITPDIPKPSKPSIPRLDEKLKHGIISHKKDGKFQKYMAGKLPDEYLGENGKQIYERQLALPLGKEWNSQTNFEKMTDPRVFVRRGVAVQPLERPMTHADAGIPKSRLNRERSMEKKIIRNKKEKMKPKNLFL